MPQQITPYSRWKLKKTDFYYRVLFFTVHETVLEHGKIVVISETSNDVRCLSEPEFHNKLEFVSEGSKTWEHCFRFARCMEFKLDKNRHKGNREGWIECHPTELIKGLHEETRELVAAINNRKDPEEVVSEAADIGNFAMMIADCYNEWITAEGQQPTKESTNRLEALDNYGREKLFLIGSEPYTPDNADKDQVYTLFTYEADDILPGKSVWNAHSHGSNAERNARRIAARANLRHLGFDPNSDTWWKTTPRNKSPEELQSQADADHDNLVGAGYVGPEAPIPDDIVRTITVPGWPKQGDLDLYPSFKITTHYKTLEEQDMFYRRHHLGKYEDGAR